MSQITWKQYQEISKQMIMEFLKNASLKERHNLVLGWNWDSGTDVLKWIANDPGTDKATALMLYWKSTPRYAKQYADRDEAIKNWAWGIDNFDIVEEVEKLFVSDFYKNHQFAFDPTNDNGMNWTTEYLDKTIKREIPKVMFESLSGENVQYSESGEFEGWAEGVPPHVWEEMKKYQVSG